MITIMTIIIMMTKPARYWKRQGGGEEGEEPAARVKVCVDRLERGFRLKYKSGLQQQKVRFLSVLTG